MSRSAACVAALVVAAATVVQAQATRPGDVVIASFAPERRTLEPGDSAVSSVEIRSNAPAPRTVWVGYSIQDPSDDWHDVDPVLARIDAGATLRLHMLWNVPHTAGLMSGAYRVVMAVWSDKPGAEGAVRLANADRRGAFRLVVHPLASDEGGERWRAGDHLLGRGRLRPELVRRVGSGYQLALSGNSCDGAELRAAAYSGLGTSVARMRTPNAPGSIAAFFLYGNAAGARDEIDIEIHNDGSRRAILTAWLDGRKARGEDVTLSFDPASGMHDYVIRRTARELEFVVDGMRLARWTSGYSREPMRLMANVWWPIWLPCAPEGEPRLLDIQHIEHLPPAP